MSDKVTLTNEQIDDLISQFVQLKVDQMSTNDLIEHVKQDLTDYYNDWSIDELETIIDEELFDELVDNVTTAPVIINLPEGTNLTRVIRSDDDYASKVDTLVDNMVASDDNETAHNTTLGRENRKKWLYNYTHDSESC